MADTDRSVIVACDPRTERRSATWLTDPELELLIGLVSQSPVPTDPAACAVRQSALDGLVAAQDALRRGVRP